VRRLEARADADFQDRHGRVHPWLEEHERFGWPTRREVEMLCETLGLGCQRFHNSPLAEWLPLLLATEQLFETGDSELLKRFNAMLNLRPFRAFIQEPGYRSIYAAMKPGQWEVEARELWSHVVMPRHEASKLDPTRMLAQRLTTFVKEQRHNEVEAGRVTALERENRELRAQLQQTTTSMAWQTWKARYGHDAWALPAGLQVNDLSPAGPSHWLADGCSPTLTWPGPFERGWHRLTIRGRLEPHHSLLLYLDYGQGFSDVHRLDFRSWNGRPEVREVHAYFHHPVYQVRLLFTQRSGLVVITGCEIVPEAAWMMALRGIGRLVQHGLTAPRKLLAERPSHRSWLHLGMDLCSRQSPAQLTPYQQWLAEQRPTPAQMEQLRIRHHHHSLSLACCLRWSAQTPLDAMAQTMASLQRLACVCSKLYITVPPGLSRPALDGVIYLDDGPDRSQASLLNEVVQQTDAEWLLNLEPGDVLESDAGLHLLDAIDREPDTAAIIMDEDRQVPERGWGEPMLKPRLTLETLRHQPELIGRGVAFRVATLRQQGFHPAYEGALFAEYLLRTQRHGGMLAQVQRVLLHRHNPLPRSQAIELVHERLREETAEPAIEQHRFDTSSGAIQPCPTALVSILIPTAGKAAGGIMHLQRCLHSLRTLTRYPRYEIIVVDHGNLSEAAVETIDHHQARRLTLSGPFNFSRAINQAAAIARGEQYLLLNDDTEVIESAWLEQLLAMSSPSVGAIGTRLLFPNGKLQHVGISLKDGTPMHPYYGQPPQPGYLRCAEQPRNWLAVTAACLLTSRNAFDKLRGFDERFELNYNDVDYCLRLWQAGFRVMMNPQVTLYHYEAMREDGRAAYRPEELQRYLERWKHKCPVDPWLPLPPEGAPC
jgi:GT2 family glycosyltransferase